MTADIPADDRLLLSALTAQLEAETARADAAEAEAKALREASEWRPRSEYDPNVHPKSFLVQYASGLIVMGRWVDNSDRAWPWKGILPDANTPTAADDRLLYWRPLPEARATLAQPAADGGK